MKHGKAFLLVAGILSICLTTGSAQIYNYTTIAGTAGTSGSTNGLGAVALFNNPTSVAVDSAGNVYVADYGNDTIRMITPVGTNWVVSTTAGQAGNTGSTDGLGSAALFYNPMSVAVDSTGNVYVADMNNNTIRMLIPTGTNWVVVTIAGQAGDFGSVDGLGSTALFSNPAAVAVDSTGNIYVADYGNDTIRMITPLAGYWTVSTIAGKAGKSGSADGTGSGARFYGPTGVAVDSTGNVYVADYGNSTIRKIVPVGTDWVVSTVGGKAKSKGSANGVGSTARFDNPIGVALDSTGNVYVADMYNDTIRRGLAMPGTFVPLTGVYSGLVIQTNAPSQASSGAFKLVLTETGSFAANLTMAGAGAAFGGQFDLSGNVTNTVTVAKTNSCHVILHLDLTGGTEEITGTVSNGAFRSDLVADRATFSKTTPCSLAGLYTFVLAPPTDTDPDLPQGYGYGTLSIATTGSGKLSGVLGDGSKLKATIPISKYGTGPLYSALYGKKGSCVAWLNFTNNNIEATAYWFKPPVSASHYYPAGSTTNVTLLGSKYVAPAKGSPMLSLTNTTGNVMLTLGGGNLGAVLSNSVTAANDNTVTIVSGGATNLALKLAPKNGTFTGSFMHPVTHKTAKFSGVVLQLQDFGAGFFAGSNETGYVVLDPVE